MHEKYHHGIIHALMKANRSYFIRSPNYDEQEESIINVSKCP